MRCDVCYSTCNDVGGGDHILEICNAVGLLNGKLAATKQKVSSSAASANTPPHHLPPHHLTTSGSAACSGARLPTARAVASWPAAATAAMVLPMGEAEGAEGGNEWRYVGSSEGLGREVAWVRGSGRALKKEADLISRHSSHGGGGGAVAGKEKEM